MAAEANNRPNCPSKQYGQSKRHIKLLTTDFIDKLENAEGWRRRHSIQRTNEWKSFVISIWSNRMFFSTSACFFSFFTEISHFKDWLLFAQMLSISRQFRCHFCFESWRPIEVHEETNEMNCYPLRPFFIEFVAFQMTCNTKPVFRKPYFTWVSSILLFFLCAQDPEVDSKMASESSEMLILIAISVFVCFSFDSKTFANCQVMKSFSFVFWIS